MSVIQPIADTTVAGGMPRRVQDHHDDNSAAFTKPVISILNRSQQELPPATFALLGETSHTSLQEWLSRQYKKIPPPEGSPWDDVLRWTEIFVERLHAFEVTIDRHGSEIATKSCYGYVAMLLEFGRENAVALRIPFNLLYETSSELEKVTRSAEVILSQEVKDQLSFALLDLTSLVASISIHIFKLITDFTSTSISVNIRETFTGKIESFKSRCAKVSFAAARHVLVKAGMDPEKVHIVNDIRSWLSPGDPVLAALVQSPSTFAVQRAEMTCQWATPYLEKWEADKCTRIHITGRPGSGKSVLSLVISDHLHDAFDAMGCLNLSVSIGIGIPAQRSISSIVRSLLFQLFDRSATNVALLALLGEALETSKKITDDAVYENHLWDALELALNCSAVHFTRINLIVDGIDEALCDETYLLQKLDSILSNAQNVTLITLGTQKPSAAEIQAVLEISGDVTLDDICKVVQTDLENTKSVKELPRIQQEAIFEDVSKACDGSFLWAKLASKHLKSQENSDHLRKAVSTLATAKPSIADMVFNILEGESISMASKQVLAWLAIAQRPLHVREIAAFASVEVDGKSFRDGNNILSTLKPFISLVYLADSLIFFRHGMIRDAVVNLLPKGKLVPNDDLHTDVVTRLLVYSKSSFEESTEPSLMSLDKRDTSILRNRYPLLDYASRYWPLHLKQMAPFRRDGATGALEKIASVLPMSTVFIRFLVDIWDRLPTPEALEYHELVTELYCKSAGYDSVITLQCMISLAIKYRKISHEKAIGLAYETTMLSKKLMTERHATTIQLADIFLELSADQVTRSHTEIMERRGECLALLVEAYEFSDEDNHEKRATASSTLAEHYWTLGEVQKAEGVMTSVQSTTGEPLPSEQPL